jgi:ABC-type branched-subunit amino acid transport system ATPase component
LADPDLAAPPALAVEEVSVRFGGLQALDAVTLDVSAGEVHGLIGPNGAGKTTLFNVITGLQRPTQGRVLVGAHNVTGYKPHARARLGLGRTFQRLELFGTLSARDNVRMAAEVQPHKLAGGRTPAEEADYQLARVGILHVADEPSDSLPTGLARLVEMARALATSPSVLLLDEPSSGLNAEETHGVGEVLQQLASEGMGVLLVEHDMALVMAICARVDVLDNGSVVARGDPATVQADPVVQEAYLGGGTASVPPASPAVARTVPLGASDGARSNGGPDAADPVSAPPALSAVDVRAGYGRIEVLHGITLSVRPGSAMALLGPNGAGKTTLLNAISGQIPLTAGTVEVAGNRLGRNATERLARSGVCMIPEGRSIFPNLTVSENLLMYTFRQSGMKSAKVEEQAFERFPALADRRKQLAGTLSGGEQRMLSMARALTTDPQILLLDELSMGLAPIIVDQLYEVVGQLVASEGLTIIMVEQFVQTALAIADEAAIMVNGELIKQGKPADIRAEVVGAYLGAETTATPS